MSPSNKEMQLRKNCELYAYLLTELGKEIPEEIEDCIADYEYVLNCVKELYKEIESLSSDDFERIINNKEKLESRELAYWWEMQREADRLHRMLSADIHEEE